MLQFIKRFFDNYIALPTKDANADTEDHAYRLATAALLIEITRADYEIKEEERLAVTEAVQRAFDLSPAETAELVQLAELESKSATQSPTTPSSTCPPCERCAARQPPGSMAYSRPVTG